MADDGWEERMAARARERQRARDAEFAERYAEERSRDLAHTASWMSLGYAIDYLRIEHPGCACIGPPDCCMDRFEVARRLHAGAHIAVKLIEDHRVALSAAPYKMRRST